MNQEESENKKLQSQFENPKFDDSEEIVLLENQEDQMSTNNVTQNTPFQPAQNL